MSKPTDITPVPDPGDSDIEYRSLRRGFYARTVLAITALYTLVSWIIGLLVESVQGMFQSRAIIETIEATRPWAAFGLAIGFFSGMLFAELADWYVDKLREMEGRARKMEGRLRKLEGR